MSDTEYELFLDCDVNNNKHNHWFFFSVKNAKPDKNYKFIINELNMDDKLYEQGCFFLGYSTK